MTKVYSKILKILGSKIIIQIKIIHGEHHPKPLLRHLQNLLLKQKILLIFQTILHPSNNHRLNPNLIIHFLLTYQEVALLILHHLQIIQRICLTLIIVIFKLAHLQTLPITIFLPAIIIISLPAIIIISPQRIMEISHPTIIIISLLQIMYQTVTSLLLIC